MQPNAPYQQPQVPHDYLNQIAAPAPVKTLNPFALWGMIGGLLILAVVVLVVVSGLGSGPSASSLTSVAARLSNLHAVSESAQENLQDSDLRKLNSDLGIAFTNTNRDLTESLKAQDIDLKSKKNETVAKENEATEALKGRLEDARLNGVYDRTYVREMLYALRTLRSDMAVLYKKTRSASLKSTLESTDKSLKPIVDGLNGLNVS